MMDAFQLFELLADQTWHRIGDAHQLGVSLGEETLTDLHALEIRRKAPAGLRIKQFTKTEEAVWGADWEWWIGADSCGWFRYAVQAKKIELPSTNYRQLRHRVSKGPPEVWQIDCLQKYGEQNNAIPLYCFYNGGIEVPHLRPWQTPSGQYGCTVTSLEVARSAHEPYAPKSFWALHQNGESFPWRCLVCLHRCRCGQTAWPALRCCPSAPAPACCHPWAGWSPFGGGSDDAPSENTRGWYRRLPADLTRWLTIGRVDEALPPPQEIYTASVESHGDGLPVALLPRWVATIDVSARPNVEPDQELRR